MSIVIVTYNRRKDLEECLDSLFRMERQPDEVLVVDSSSTDETGELCRRYPVKYRQISVKGMTKARNIALTHVTNDIVAFVDDDVVLSKNWLSGIMQTFKVANVGGVCTRVIPYGENATLDESGNEKIVGRVLGNGLVIGNFDAPLKEPIEVDTLVGCGMAIRRDLLVQAGGFDENYVGNCLREETDMCIRISNLAYRLVYQPKIMLWHKYRGKNMTRRWFYWTTYNQLYFFLKNFHPKGAKRLLILFHGILFLSTLFLYVRKAGDRVEPDPVSAIYAIAGFRDAARLYGTLQNLT